MSEFTFVKSYQEWCKSEGLDASKSTSFTQWRAISRALHARIKDAFDPLVIADTGAYVRAGDRNPDAIDRGY